MYRKHSILAYSSTNEACSTEGRRLLHTFCSKACNSLIALYVIYHKLCIPYLPNDPATSFQKIALYIFIDKSYCQFVITVRIGPLDIILFN